ncbi:MAG: hypothetical protein II669_03345, partial [Elusimicrobia bacterium]|nr:hypothetical protein [Elusimicrobiota bacterium]
VGIKVDGDFPTDPSVIRNGGCQVTDNIIARQHHASDEVIQSCLYFSILKKTIIIQIISSINRNLLDVCCIAGIANIPAETEKASKTPPKTLPETKYIIIKIKKIVGKTNKGY